MTDLPTQIKLMEFRARMDANYLRSAAMISHDNLAAINPRVTPYSESAYNKLSAKSNAIADQIAALAEGGAGSRRNSRPRRFSRMVEQVWVLHDGERLSPEATSRICVE